MSQATVNEDAQGTAVWATIDSPVGEILVIGDGEAVTHLYMTGEGGHGRDERPGRNDPAALADALEQLEQYFAGERTEFDLPLRPQGTEFQRSVWHALEQIPYGETRSYGQIAAAVGRPKAARAVGMANNRNPISVFIPCHRVVGADGALVGYGGGMSRKVWLLDHEAERSANSSS